MAGQRKQNPLRTYLSKDYSSFKSDLLTYAKTFFPEKIQDFSDASMGGLLLDMAAAVGDNLSFYLDHQFRETIWSDAVEIKNIEKMIINSGIKITGASPSVVNVSFYIEVPAVNIGGTMKPDTTSLPTILQGTLLSSKENIPFTTIEDLDFSEIDQNGELNAEIIVGNVNKSGIPETFILVKDVEAISGKIYVETFYFNSTYKPFTSVSLFNADVSEILSVIDSSGDEWYEVDNLSQDTVFAATENLDYDKKIVKKNLKIISAPKRYILNTDLQRRTSRLLFGSGDPTLYDDDAFPDPSKLVLPLYGKNTVSRFSIDPNMLIKSRTMGIAPASTTLTVTYRAGGGVSHNVASNSIRTIKTLRISFKESQNASIASKIRASVDVVNNQAATGGQQALTINELRQFIPAARNMQSRIVTKSDLLSRVYSLPSKFGNVYRANVIRNPNNPLSTQLFVLSRDNYGRVIFAPDTLKKNLRTYLNEYRLISDAIDVVDGHIINYGVNVSIITTPGSNSSDIVKNVILQLQKLLDIKNFQIDQPIIISEIITTVLGVQGVLSLLDIRLENISGFYDNRNYSNTFYDFEENTIKGLVFGPPGSIFELKYPNVDIVVSAK